MAAFDLVDAFGYETHPVHGVEERFDCVVVPSISGHGTRVTPVRCSVNTEHRTPVIT
jgi:hypothetical protein